MVVDIVDVTRRPGRITAPADREESRRCLEDNVGPAQFGVLAPQRIQFGGFLGCGPGAHLHQPGQIGASGPTEAIHPPDNDLIQTGWATVKPA